MAAVGKIPHRELLLARASTALLALIGPTWTETATLPRPSGLVWGVLAAWILSAVPLARSWRAEAPRRIAGLHLLGDVAALSAILALEGGAENPFTALYFVPLALSTQLSPRWTAGITAAILAGFAALLALPDPHGPDHRTGAMDDHLRGMWIAYACSGVLVGLFMHRVATALDEKRRAFHELERTRAEERHAAALGTLAAGAAHELSTPLGTLELLAADLEAMDEDERSDAIETMRRQIRRCRQIVDDMASPELVVTGPTARRDPVTLDDLVRDIADLGPPRVVVVHVAPDARDRPLRLPRRIVTRQLREIVTNALRALSDAPKPGDVEVRFEIDDDRLRVRVEDRGVGMSDEALARAFDPFFAQRTDGTGTGLGLFLVRAQLRRMGGTIRLSRSATGGTVEELSWPIGPSAPG
ncbi:MAG: sensor histidine kinase [Deltaproteobacteria bacterium]|nr:MAG: sensor histidine kinase [Deltaproteobacteria bacterium]